MATHPRPRCSRGSRLFKVRVCATRASTSLIYHPHAAATAAHRGAGRIGERRSDGPAGAEIANIAPPQLVGEVSTSIDTDRAGSISAPSDTARGESRIPVDAAAALTTESGVPQRSGGRGEDVTPPDVTPPDVTPPVVTPPDVPEGSVMGEDAEPHASLDTGYASSIEDLYERPGEFTDSQTALPKSSDTLEIGSVTRAPRESSVSRGEAGAEPDLPELVTVRSEDGGEDDHAQGAGQHVFSHASAVADRVLAQTPSSGRAARGSRGGRGRGKSGACTARMQN